MMLSGLTSLCQQPALVIGRERRNQVALDPEGRAELLIPKPRLRARPVQLLGRQAQTLARHIPHHVIEPLGRQRVIQDQPSRLAASSDRLSRTICGRLLPS